MTKQFKDTYTHLSVNQILDQVPIHCNRCGAPPRRALVNYDPILLRVIISVECHGEELIKNICSVSLRHDPQKHLSVFSAPQGGIY